MNTEETADLGLPRTFRSPWRWVGIVIGVVLMLVGISGFAVGESGSMVVAVVFVVVGVLVGFVSWRSGVLVDRDHVRQRGMGRRAERRLWIDVAGVKIVPGPSVLPSRTVVLVDRNGGEDLTLTSLSWYPIRSREPRRVARFIQTANTFIKP
jgi:hypothetical protein